MLGRPIAHSLSPLLHRAAYSALGLDWRYEAVDCGEHDLPGVLAARPDWAGFSCTMPLKHAVLEVAAEVRPAAAAVGAGNTLLPRGAGWVAENTDVAGIVTALTERGAAPASVTVLGAGGTAQAAVAALAQLGRDGCTVLLRDRRKAGPILATAERAGVTVELGDLPPDAERAPALAAELVISTLPPGAADPFARYAWSARQWLLDVVYAPWPTRVADAAAAAGSEVIGGEAMLLHQAAAQVRLMTGHEAPVAAMRAALDAALAARG